jgi:hypothetical protein
MSSSFTDFLNTHEINADSLSGIITSRNVDIANHWYRAVIVEAEEQEGILRKQMK